MGGNRYGKGIQALLTADKRGAAEYCQEGREDERHTYGVKGFAEGYRRYTAIYAWPKWWWISALVIALAIFSVLPGRAYAVSEQVIINDGIVTKPNSDQVTRGFMVLAYNRLNAGALICGYDPSTFTAEQKAKLSQKISGNNFYGLCSYLSTTEDSGVPYWASSNYELFSTIWDLNSDVAGMDLWIGDFSEHELELAKRDIQKVLDGEEIVPPSGGESTDYISFASALAYQSYSSNTNNTPVLVDGSGKCYTYRPAYYYEDGEVKYRFGTGESVNDAAQIGPVLSVALDRSIASGFEGNDYGLLIWAMYDSGNYLMKFQLFRSTVHTNKNNEIINNLPYVDSLTYTGHTSVCNAYPENSNKGNYYYTITDAEHIAIHKRDGVSAISFNNNTGTQQRNISYQLLVTGGSVQPPNNWPDDPPVVAPSPPELPTPTDPVIPSPPVDPTPPDPPTYITQPYYVTNIFTADLQGILDALDEHCQHLQDALYSDLKSLNDNLVAQISSEGSSLRSSFGSRINWLGDIIQRTIDTLDFNIHSYFQWLADQFDFQNSGGYNDSTVVAWLKKIYAKLGGGSPVNPKPVDPVSDPFDFGEWLYQLWQNFVLDLLALGANGIAEIAHDLGELIHKFPFSIPWDIAAMLALLAAEPQTPVITWPMFYLDAGGVQTVQTTIDLHPYDNYVEPVRVMIKIAFAAVLAWRTKDMMELLTAARGGNSA